MQSGYLSLIYEILTYKIYLKEIFLDLLKLLTHPKVKFNEMPIGKNLILESHELSTPFENIKTNSLSSPKILFRNIEIKYTQKINKDGEFFKILIPKINFVPAINTILIWQNADLYFQIIQRIFSLKIFTEVNYLLKSDININKSIKINKISDDLIEPDRRLRVTEEIVTMMPYVKQIKPQNLMQIPITKKPLYKYNFSDIQMNYFRELMAAQNKTSKVNIEILNLYDKFSTENFSSMKQDQASKNLLCYLNLKHTDLNENNLYYLVIGRRKDNNTPLKIIAKMKTVNAL